MGKQLLPLRALARAQAARRGLAAAVARAICPRLAGSIPARACFLFWRCRGVAAAITLWVLLSVPPTRFAILWPAAALLVGPLIDASAV